MAGASAHRPDKYPQCRTARFPPPASRRSGRAEDRSHVASPYLPPWLRGFATLCLMAMAVPPAWAQTTVQGTVLDAESGIPIYTADVAVLATDDSVVGRSITDEDGRFVVLVAHAGSYRLRATRIGYVPFTTDSFVLGPGQDAVAELSLQLSPIPLDPLEPVVERPQPRRLVQVGFYKRQASAWGFFQTPEDLEARHLILHEDLFSGMGGIRVRSRGRVITPSECELTIFLDGVVLTETAWTDLVHVNDIEAIEVYPRLGGIPVWARRDSPCGAVIIWLKGSLR